MQSQASWQQQGLPVRAPGRVGGAWGAQQGGGVPFSYPGVQRSAQLPVRPAPAHWSQSYTRDEDYGNLVSQGFGSQYHSDHPFGSPHSESCCSPPGSEDAGWVSPMDAQPVYLSPLHFQSPSATQFGFVHAPSFSAASQCSISDSEDETVSCARSPDSGPYFNRANLINSHHNNVFELDMDEPSTTTTAGDDEDGEEEETTVDDVDPWDETFADDLDTSVDYSYLHGAVESPLDLDAFPVTLNASKTPCLDALAFCVVMRLGAYQTPEDELDGSITITNFSKFLAGIHQFCPKKSQTANEEARIKALKRWFEGIPTKRKRDSVFVMRIKDRKNPLVIQIIKKLQTFCIAHGWVKARNPQTQLALRPNA